MKGNVQCAASDCEPCSAVGEVGEVVEGGSLLALSVFFTKKEKRKTRQSSSLAAACCFGGADLRPLARRLKYQ